MKLPPTLGLLLPWLLTAQVLAQSRFDGQWRIDDTLTQSTIHYDYVLQAGMFRCTTAIPRSK